MEYLFDKRVPAYIEGMVKTDRAVIYAKQYLTNLRSEINARTTKTIGNSVYRIQRLRRDILPLFEFSGDRIFIDKFMSVFIRLNERTPKGDAVKAITELIDFLESYEFKISEESDIQILKNKIEKLEQQLADNSDEPIGNIDISSTSTVFVIMPFNKDFNDVWKGGIEKGAKAEGFNPLRIDLLNKSTNITDDIIESIEKCQIAIVDVTGNNPNVMFELGYTMASSKPNIIISQSVEYLPFDIRNIRTIVYSNTWSGIEELRQKVQEFLQEFAKKRKTPSKTKK